MLGIELSKLSVAELKRLGEVARSRGQTMLASAISAELAARTGQRPGDERPIEFTPPQPPAPPPRRRTAMRPAAVTIAAGFAGVLTAALTWGLHIPKSVEPTPMRAPQRVAIALVETPTELTQPEVEAAAATPGPAPAAEPAVNPCYAKPTPAERLLCGYPSLAIADRQLQGALARAAAAGADVAALDEAGWRSRRDRIWDRKQLAALYARRIAEVEAATTAAQAVAAADQARPE